MKTALVAVSGGSDSLALLDILIKKGEYELVVAHINYNYRESSLRDEEIVREYCEKNNIEIFVKSVNSKEEKDFRACRCREIPQCAFLQRFG